ncbi:glycoside hydrolase family 3 C-terminal domain-containing protein [Paenibacillus sp. strain BS8-2]
MKILQLRKAKRPVAAALSCLMAVSVAFTIQAPSASADAVVIFNTQVGGVYDGMPLFDGNPAHLDAFVDTYYDYIGLEGASLYATGIRDNYTFVMDDNPRKGKTVPGGLSAADNVSGVSTDFPVLLGMGQTWNKDLVARIGQVMGSEKISQLNVKQGTANNHNGSGAAQSRSIAFTALSDVRVNPLNGRFHEGYSEDPYLSATMIDSKASGLAGTNLGESDDGFWIRAVVGTKHFSMYNAEWFRQSSSTAASARAIFEYQIPSAFKGLESGSVSGIMTSFGRTNGIPNIISPYLIKGNEIAKYGMYSSPDFNGENHLFNTNFSNGYDARYTLDRKHALALMVLAHSESVRASGTDKTDVVTLANATKEGLYGLTLEHVIEAGRPLVNQLVRLGIFNEPDENGIPKNYPFANQAKDVASTLTNFSTPAHQEVALEAARETVVLLKNTDGALPLQKNEKAAVAGVYADMRMRPQYTASTPTTIDNSGKTPLYTLLNTIGADKVQFATGGEVVALKSKLNGQYLTSASGNGDQLTANYTPTAGEFTNSQLFEVTDWGQNAFSFKSLANNRWLSAPTANGAAVGNTATASLLLTGADWSNLSSVAINSTVPPKLRVENNADDTLSVVSGGLGFQTGVFNGRFVTTDAQGKIAAATSTIGNLAGFNTRTDATKFEKTVVKEAGADFAAMADTQDYALVFVGAHPGNSAGEGNDRADLYLGEGDYKLVKNVAAAFAAKNKKTVVVLLTTAPVIMKEIQEDPNVSAIVMQPYSGQYESQGLIDVLYGDYAPTGRLTSTWYADMGALPAIDSYSIPEGSTLTMEQLDPRYVSDMNNADPVEANLTYMYTDSEVTYEFGYGLGYAEFTYKDFSAPTAASGNGTFNVSVEITNEGDVATSEVVQLYAKNNNPAYGDFSRQKQLVGYEKVELTAGEHKVVTMTVDAKDLAIWDVNKGDYVIESGNYSLLVGHSSKDIRQTNNIQIVGEELAQLNAADGFNVFDHAFASHHVVYNEVSKQRTVDQLTADQVAGGYYTVTSKDASSWVALPKANFTGAEKVKAMVASKAAGGTITLHADSLASEPFATLEVPVTQVTPYTMRNTAQTVNELGFVEIEGDVAQAPAGSRTIYLKFSGPDIRVDSIQAVGSAVTATQGTLTGPSVARPGQAVTLTAGLENLSAGFSSVDVIVHYDPQQLAFAMDEVELEGGTLAHYLKDTAITAVNSEIAIAGAAIKPELGEIKVLLASTGAEIESDGPLFTLQATVKPAVSGASLVALADFHINRFIEETEEVVTTVVEPASHTIVVSEVDLSGLAAAITGAQNLLTIVQTATEGTNPGQYAAGSITSLQSSIAAAQAVLMDNTATQADITAAIASIQTIVATVNNSKVPSIPVDLDKTAIIAAITTAEAKLANAVIGTVIGQYNSDKSALEQALAAAKTARDHATTQTTLNGATTALNNALQLFQGGFVTLVAGQSQVTVKDLTIVANHYGATAAEWNKFGVVNPFGVSVDRVNIQILAYVARLILDDWLQQ